jgi:CBS-domain-containing membrane protein
MKKITGLNVASVVVSDDAATMASQQSTFGAVLRMLATTHIHHVWVTDAAGKPIGCVSMTDVCALICDSADYM